MDSDWHTPKDLKGITRFLRQLPGDATLWRIPLAVYYARSIADNFIGLGTSPKKTHTVDTFGMLVERRLAFGLLCLGEKTRSAQALKIVAVALKMKVTDFGLELNETEKVLLLINLPLLTVFRRRCAMRSAATSTRRQIAPDTCSFAWTTAALSTALIISRHVDSILRKYLSSISALKSRAQTQDGDRDVLLSPPRSHPQIYDVANDLHRLGNLTLLEKEANSAIGNKLFDEKKKKLYSKDVTKFALTHQVFALEAWNTAAFRVRHADLLQLLHTIWKLEEGTLGEPAFLMF